VLIKKLVAITIAKIIPKKNSPNANDKNISVEIKKQKLNRRGNTDLRNFLECVSSSVLKTVGDVTTIKEVIVPSKRALNNNPMSVYMHGI
jgi:hypothetical protein